MQHFFGTFGPLGKIRLSPEDEHHLLNVKRASAGERIEVCVDQNTFLCQIASLHPLEITLLESVQSRELPFRLAVAFGLLKHEHNELIVQKCTEVGAFEFFPFVSHRTIIRPSSQEDSKLLRLRKIATESSKQCRRSIVPNVHGYVDFDEILKLPYDLKLIAYENDSLSGTPLSTYLNSQKACSALLLIGPEGGFEPKEVDSALRNGFQTISLGKRILRAETACIYGSSLVSSWMENA